MGKSYTINMKSWEDSSPKIIRYKSLCKH
jgi:hypothetical protein